MIEGDDAMTSIVAPVQVEIFSDVVCPWCYIGKTRFDAALQRLGSPNLTVVYSPFQLDPTAPIGAPTPVREAYAKKFGGDAKARAIIENVTATAATDGLSFAMDRALRANTRLAHRLLLAAETESPERQATLYDHLFRAYFCDGVDIGDPESLTQLALLSGLDTTIAYQALNDASFDDALSVRLSRAADRDITAVPTFVINDQWSIPGAHDVDFFERALRRTLGLS